jgi:hypothetical protein
MGRCRRRRSTNATGPSAFVKNMLEVSQNLASAVGVEKLLHFRCHLRARKQEARYASTEKLEVLLPDALSDRDDLSDSLVHLRRQSIR